jgi:hypothetical protein
MVERADHQIGSDPVIQEIIMSETATIDAPETDVVAPTETAPEQTAPETTETPFEAVDVSKVRVADAIEKGVEVLKAATDDPARRAELDANALEILAKHYTNQRGQFDVVEHRVELPMYKDSGVGSLRYTKQRAQLLKGLADANALGAVLQFNRYTYPNPSTGRRQHYVVLLGAQCDIDRTVAMFTALQARAVKMVYDTEVVPTANLKRPVDQTKARRAWFESYAQSTGVAVDTAFQAVIDAKNAGGPINDRESKAMAALEAFMAAKTEGDDETESFGDE